MLSAQRGCSGRALVVCLSSLLLAVTAVAQEAPAPRVEVYGGYLWYNPSARLNGTQLRSMDKGFEGDVTFFANKYVGFNVGGSGSFSDPADVTTILAGPVIKFRNEQGLSPFIHFLVGLHRVMPASGGLADTNNGVGIAAGGGFDIDVNRHFALRLLQADYLYAHHNYTGGADGARDWDTGARIGGGIVLKFGNLGPPAAPPSASCSAQPGEVMAGEPVTVTANAQNFPPKRTVTYNWTTTGGKTSGNQQSTQVDTTGLAPGTYRVTANLSTGKKNETASCNASFSVKEQPKNPPTISCTANPTSVNPGETATITCQATSPDNRPVTTTFESSGGKLTPSGNTATLDTTGVQPGSITVTAKAADDRGLTGSTTASVTVNQPPPPPPPPPTASKLNEIGFTHNPAKPWRVDNEAKGILDDVALRLQREPDAKAVIVGDVDPDERGGVRLAQQRAVNTKGYLTTEKGIDPSRIEVRSGTAGGKRAEIYIVPAGATFNVEGTQTFTEFPPQLDVPRRAPARRPAARRPAAPTTPQTPQ